MYNWELDKVGKKIFELLELEGIFNTPLDIKDKLIKGLSILFIYDLSPEEQNILLENYSNYRFTINVKKSFKRKVYVKIFIKYYIIGIIGAFLNFIWKLKNIRMKKVNDVKLIINSMGRVNRLKQLSKLAAHNYLMLYFYNKNFIRNFLKIFREKDALVALPNPPTFSILRKFDQINNNTVKLLPLFEDVSCNCNKLIEEVLIYFYKNIIHYYWAKNFARNLIKNIPNVNNVIFDYDGGNKELFVLNELRKQKIRTTTIQHGMMTDPVPYIPVADFMLCCSERDKELLMKAGVQAHRLFIYGLPLQVLDSIFEESCREINKNKIYDLLIIATSGPLWYQQELIESIRSIIEKLDKKNIAIRLHPSQSKTEKELWKSLCIRSKNISLTKGTSLYDDIMNAKQVICTSIDPMVPLIYYSIPTIYLLSSKNKKEYYIYLEMFENVKLFTSREINISCICEQSERLYDFNEIKFIKLIGEYRWYKILLAFQNMCKEKEKEKA